MERHGRQWLNCHAAESSRRCDYSTRSVPFHFCLPRRCWPSRLPTRKRRIAALETAVKNAQSAGDNAWMLVSSALVLMMTGPGLALFYGGLVRRKNVLGTMMQSFILMAVVTVLWAVVGYSLAFGGSAPFIGDLQLRVPERRRQRAEHRLRRHHPAADLHGLPVDVRDHHPGADLRRVRRADEIQRDAALHACCGACSCISRWPTWCGARAAC